MFLLSDAAAENVTEASTAATAVSDLLNATMGLSEVTRAPGPFSGLTNTTVDHSVISTIFAVNYCSRWKQTNHIYYQVANALFLVAFLAPHGACGLLWLRGVLLPACGAAALWAWTVECCLDALLWNCAFFAINLVHFVVLLYKLRPVRFPKELEEVYATLFLPLRVSRSQFRRVLRCMRAVRQLKCHELYAHERVTRVDSLSLVLTGKLVVSQNQRALHIVFPHHFLDSPEWFGVSTDDFFQVSIMAMEESRVLVWHRDKLKLSIMSDGFLQSVFDHILGRDVVHKLMQVSETMGVSNGHLPNSSEEGEDKPMLVVKKSGDAAGITALLTRQLQGEHAPLLNGVGISRVSSSLPVSFTHPPHPPQSQHNYPHPIPE